ncbi:MAG TPA: hypothetical protein VGB59_08395 [Allosphingosinicella sp.]|jgi:hypothetical protein
MPRYYFHLQREDGALTDEEGMKLPDAEAAWYQAVRSARELIRAELTLGGQWERQAIVIADEGGAPVERLPLSDVARYAM